MESETKKRVDDAIWWRDRDGYLARFTNDSGGVAVEIDDNLDEVPQSLHDNPPEVPSILWGVIRDQTEEESSIYGEFDEWWDVEFRPASDAEVLEIFGPNLSPWRPIETVDGHDGQILLLYKGTEIDASPAERLEGEDAEALARFGYTHWMPRPPLPDPPTETEVQDAD